MDKYRCNWWGLQIFLSVYGSEQLHTKLLDNKHKLDGQSLKEKYFCWPACLTDPMQLLDWQNYYSKNWLIQSRLKKKCFVQNRIRQTQTWRPGQEISSNIKQVEGSTSMHLICLDFSVGLWRTFLDRNVTGFYSGQFVLLPWQVACCKVAPHQAREKWSF